MFSIKNLFVLARGLAEQLTHMFFSPTLCDSNMLERNNFLNMNFLILLYAHQYASNFHQLILFFFLLLHFFLHDFSHKYP